MTREGHSEGPRWEGPKWDHHLPSPHGKSPVSTGTKINGDSTDAMWQWLKIRIPNDIQEWLYLVGKYQWFWAISMWIHGQMLAVKLLKASFSRGKSYRVDLPVRWNQPVNLVSMLGVISNPNCTSQAFFERYLHSDLGLKMRYIQKP